MAGCGSKSGYQKDMYSKEDGLCAQNMITILGSIINLMGGGTCMTTYSELPCR